MKKINIQYEDIHRLVFKLSKKIKDKYSPDVIIAISGGGLIPSRILRTFINIPILCVGVKLYNENNSIVGTPVKTQWINCLNKDELSLIENKNILIIDEVDDTRTTLEYVINELNKINPKNIAVGVIHNKLKEKKGKIPNYCLYFSGEDVEDNWINYPWESKNIDNHYSQNI